MTLCESIDATGRIISDVPGIMRCLVLSLGIFSDVFDALKSGWVQRKDASIYFNINKIWKSVLLCHINVLI